MSSAVDSVANRSTRKCLTRQKSASPKRIHSGMDVFGPFYIKKGRKTLKRYGLLFTCLASRVVHLETINYMEADSFISALRCFIDRRGNIREMCSDRGTNFVGARSELNGALQELDRNCVQDPLRTKECDWICFNLNVPAASHMGDTHPNSQISSLGPVTRTRKSTRRRGLTYPNDRGRECHQQSPHYSGKLVTAWFSRTHYAELLTDFKNGDCTYPTWKFRTVRAVFKREMETCTVHGQSVLVQVAHETKMDHASARL